MTKIPPRSTVSSYKKLDFMIQLDDSQIVKLQWSLQCLMKTRLASIMKPWIRQLYRDARHNRSRWFRFDKMYHIERIPDTMEPNLGDQNQDSDVLRCELHENIRRSAIKETLMKNSITTHQISSICVKE